MKKIIGALVLSIFVCLGCSGHAQETNKLTPQFVIDFYYPTPPCPPCDSGHGILKESAQREIDFVKNKTIFLKALSSDKVKFQEHCLGCEQCRKFSTKEPEPVKSVLQDPVPVSGPFDGILKKLEERFNKNDEALQKILKDNEELKSILDKFPSVQIFERFDRAQESVEGIRSSLARLIDSILKDREDLRKEFKDLRSLIERIKPFDQQEVAGLRDRISELMEEVRQNREQAKAYDGILSNLGKRLEEFRNENSVRMESFEKRFSPLIEITARLEESIKNLAQAMAWLLLAALVVGVIIVIGLAVLGAIYTKISKKISG
jgi:thiol-disulfide isomerase/thioredoxin